MRLPTGRSSAGSAPSVAEYRSGFFAYLVRVRDRIRVRVRARVRARDGVTVRP